ncbi:MAG: Dabb family protein [Spirulina sp. SIO3F2]|nr:Dabb family protein [Spirulina sp. SIO3F2]
MIEHIVLFKWQPTAAPEAIASVMTALGAMPRQITEIVALSCGENFSNRAQGFTHGLVVRLADRTALDAYQAHPAHQVIVQTQIKPIVAEVLALDYEFIPN